MTDPVAVITGASRGIGKQLAVAFAEAGYDVCCLARSTLASPTKLPGTIEETAALIERTGRRALALQLDVRSEEQVAAVAERVYAELGRCDVLINNAAISVAGRTLEVPSKYWRLAVDINLLGPYYMVRHFCPRMIAAGGGVVINISSNAAVRPEFGRSSYSATKAALEVLTQVLAFELKDEGVGVYVIRLDVPVWTEGYAASLPTTDTSDFEDPVIMCDAALWLAKQPWEYAGHILTISQLREMGVVRAVTPANRSE